MDKFKLVSTFKPTGDQPQAIEKLVQGFKDGNQFETLLGVTGSGKTFTMANIIAALNKPTLIISHNKTLAGQLYGEMKEFFPENAVEYFVSYYDYYQPEAYVPQTDTYIAKDSSINDEIDKLRLSATASLAERNDVIVVASVSCIYGLGSPDEFKGMSISLRPGMSKDRDDVIKDLIAIQYQRNDMDLSRCNFRVHGDVVEVFPANADDYLIRIEFFGDEIDRICEVEPLSGKVTHELEHVMIYPASHYVVPQEKINKACDNIEKELERLNKEKARLEGEIKRASGMLNNPKFVGIAVSSINMVGMLGNALSPTVFGALLEHYSVSYSGGDLYKMVFIPCIVLSVVSLILTLLSRETDCQNCYADITLESKKVHSVVYQHN